MQHDLAAAMLGRLLDVRRVHLSHRAPRSKSLHQLRRDLACGKTRAMHSLLAVAFADIEDGAPVEAVASVFELIADVLRARGREIAHEGHAAPSLLPLILREGRRQHAEDEAERIALHTETPESLETLLDASAAEIAAQTERDAGVRARLAVLRTHPSPVEAR